MANIWGILMISSHIYFECLHLRGLKKQLKEKKYKWPSAKNLATILNSTSKFNFIMYGY